VAALNLNFSGRSTRLSRVESPAAALNAPEGTPRWARSARFCVARIEPLAAGHRAWTRQLHETLADAGWTQAADGEGAPVPRVTRTETTWWSASHSGTHGAFVAGTVPVGVDLECDRTLRSPERLWARIANSKEREAAESFFEPQSLIGLWTSKEAVAKGRGEGIRRDFRTLVWQPLKHDLSVVTLDSGLRGGEAEVWLLAHQRAADHWLSLAMRMSGTT
jgi:hypothetical protein